MPYHDAMTDNMIELAKRAVACPKWRLMPGMLTDEGRRVMRVWPDDLGIKWSHLLDNRVVRDADALPDLTDPATLGCLLALVREAWGADFIDVVCEQANDLEDGGYVWRVNLPWGKGTRGPTEAEALVTALEAAP